MNQSESSSSDDSKKSSPRQDSQGSIDGLENYAPSYQEPIPISEPNTASKRKTKTEQDLDKLRVAAARSKIEREHQIHEDTWDLRKEFGRAMKWLVVGWTLLIFGLLICQGSNWLQLTDTVVVTLLTTTTANIFAFLYIILKFLFPSSRLD